MANTTSAKKRVRQTQRRTLHHRKYRTMVRTACKKAAAAPQNQELLRATVALIQRVAAKGIIHPNRAANLVSRLSRLQRARLQRTSRPAVGA